MQLYTVMQGDTIYSISRKFNVPVEDIVSANSLKEPNKLALGESLIIPGYTEKMGTISINGYAYPSINRDTLQKTLPYLTFLTIFTYGFTEEGELIPIDDEELIDIAIANKVAPLMMLSTLSPEGTFSNELANSILNDLEAQDVLIENVLENIRAKNYYGLDVDFEYIFKEDRDAYTAFIEKITKILNSEGYLVLVALAPKTSSTQPGLLYESHDYRALGQASNAVLLMTYEWGYTYGPPMAVSPINKVREVLDYGVSEIPSNKILMGIPNYAYDWKLPYIRGESKAKSISNVNARNLAVEKSATILFDEVAQTPYYYYTDTDGAEHVVWFEDPRSIYAKLQLIYEYVLGGCAYWNIMAYFPQNWYIVNQLYNVFKLIK